MDTRLLLDRCAVGTCHDVSRESGSTGQVSRALPALTSLAARSLRIAAALLMIAGATHYPNATARAQSAPEPAPAVGEVVGAESQPPSDAAAASLPDTATPAAPAGTTPSSAPADAPAQAPESATPPSPATTVVPPPAAAPASDARYADQAAEPISPPPIERSNPGYFYVGAALSPLTVKGLSDVDASDWVNFGHGSEEGRVSLALGDGATDGAQFGARAGYETGQTFPALFELGLYPGSFFLLTGALGLGLRPVQTDIVDVELMPKIGYMVGLRSLGDAQVLPGKTPPIVTPEGAFEEGDSVSARVSGVFAQLGITTHLKVTRVLGIRLDFAYQFAYLPDFAIEAGDVKLRSDSSSLLRPGSNARSNLDPKATASGLSGVVGMTYRP